MALDTGRLIAYIGGLSVSGGSYADQAANIAAESISLSQVTVPVLEITVRDIAVIGGLVVVVVRLGWDIWKYFDERRRKQRDALEG